METDMRENISNICTRLFKGIIF